MKSIEGIFLPEYKCSMMIEHNNHKDYYQTVEQHIERGDVHGEWISEDEKQKAVETNEMWMIQWYPETPIGFYCLYASSFTALMEYFKIKKEDGQ